MRRLLVLPVFLLFFSTHSGAQTQGYISAGYGFSFGSYSGFNEFIKSYNSLRTWLAKPMPKATELNGVCVGFGWMTDHFLMDMQWTGRHHTFQASGPQPSFNGLNGYREMKYRMNTFNTGLGIGGGNEVVKIFAGFSVDIGFSETYTRVWDEGEATPKFTNTENSKTSIATSLFLDLRTGKTIMIGVKPYYQIHFLKHDFNSENQVINQAGYVFYEDDPKYSSAPSNFGIELKLFLNFK